MDYDLAIVGGGLAASSLGGALARVGARVAIFEREPMFRDRVRGEGSFLGKPPRRGNSAYIKF
jgi:flavin-dependent dehydrogenase